MRKIISKTGGTLTILVFVGAVVIPSVKMLVLNSNFGLSITENRRLSRWPGFPKTHSELKKWPGKLDDFFGDHFGFRDELLTQHNRFKIAIGDSSSEKVLMGHNGWLFLKGPVYLSPVRDFLGLDHISEDELDRANFVISARQNWFQSKGIKYLFMIAPNKHSVYGELLHSWLNKKKKESATDQLLKKLKNDSGLKVFYPKSILMSHKGDRHLYSKTDTHWNLWGANIVQASLLAIISETLGVRVEAKKHNLSEYEFKEGLGGDLSVMLGMQNTIRELWPSLPNSLDKACAEKRNTSVNGEEFETVCKGKKLKALVFRDSFFTAIQPYFSQHFAKVKYVWKRMSYSQVQAHLKEDHYDIVLEEWVERALPAVPAFESEFFESDIENLAKLKGGREITKLVADKIKPMGGTRILNEKSSEIILEGTNFDPGVVLMGMNVSGSIALAIHVTVPVATIGQIYLSSRGASFRESHSIRYALPAQGGILYVPIGKGWEKLDIRIDPGEAPGRYGINKIMIYDQLAVN